MTTRVAALPDTLARAPCDDEVARDVWIGAASKILTTEGSQAISIARLARELQVTRGAFYWHFENRQTLLFELHKHLEARCRPPVLPLLGRSDFDTGMLAMLDAVFEPCAETRQAEQIEGTLLLWSATDAEVHDAVVLRHVERSAAIHRFLLRNGCSTAEARLRARILCTMCFGQGAEDLRQSEISYPTDLPCLFRYIAGRDLAAAALSRHLNRTLPARRQSRLEGWSIASPAAIGTATTVTRIRRIWWNVTISGETPNDNAIRPISTTPPGAKHMNST